MSTIITHTGFALFLAFCSPDGTACTADMGFIEADRAPWTASVESCEAVAVERQRQHPGAVARHECIRHWYMQADGSPTPDYYVEAPTWWRAVAEPKSVKRF